jgi:hypothetical protein
MNLEPHDRRQVEHLLQRVLTAWRTRGTARSLPGGQMVVLSDGLQVTIALEPGVHAGQGGPDEPRLWLGVSRPDRFPTFHELQLLIGLVFSASQQGAANPLAISTGMHMPYLVLLSSRVSRLDSRPS